jgi:hypothetical protein
MRSLVLLLPMAVLVGVAGCKVGAGEQMARSVPERDLTLVQQTSEMNIASPVETRRPQIERQTRWVSRARASSARRPITRIPVTTISPPAELRTATQTIVEPTRAPTAAPNDRELLPGKTVTLIPASSGPSTETGWSDDFPVERGRAVVSRGGQCGDRGRRPGIGIATRPRPDFR